MLADIHQAELTAAYNATGDCLILLSILVCASAILTGLAGCLEKTYNFDDKLA